MKKNFAKEYWTKSQVSLVKIIVTAIAAISVSFISTKLNDYKGVYLAGIIAVISLLLNEIYNFVFQWIQYETAKATGRAPEEAPHEPQKTPNEFADAFESYDPSPGDQDAPLPPDIATKLDNWRHNADTKEPTENIAGKPKKNKNFLKTIGNFFNRHQNLRLFVFFILVSAVILGVNHYSPRVETVVNPMITVDVDETTKQEIVGAAADLAKEHASTTIIETPSNSEESKSEILAETQTQITDSQISIESKYSDLQNLYNDLLIKYSEQATEIELLKSEVAAVLAQLDDIESSLEEKPSANIEMEQQ